MKKIFLVISILTLLTTLALIVNAHPGNTDGAGGHTDHNTGEYHYHHGYPAHNHYDMDGDGDVDCPYEFDYNTNHSSNNSNDIDTEIDIDFSNLPTIPTFDFQPVPNIESELYDSSMVNGADSKEKDAQSKDISFGDFLLAIFECSLLAIAIGVGASHLLSYIFYLVFGDDKGCTITLVSFIVISIFAFIWLIYCYIS